LREALTTFQGNLDERCTDALVWELMLQAGPVGTLCTCFLPICTSGLIYYYFTVNVHLPKDRISMAHQGYGFCEFLTEEDAEYACKIMNQIKLWGKPIRVNKVIIGYVSFTLFDMIALSIFVLIGLI
jgi:splicing factor 3B subunit 4